MTDLGPVLFDQAGHVIGSNALGPSPHLPVLEQLPPLAFFYVSESNASRRNSLLERPCCFIASSTRSAISGGNEKVMVLVVLGMIASLLSSLTRMPAHHRSPVNHPRLRHSPGIDHTVGSDGKGDRSGAPGRGVGPDCWQPQPLARRCGTALRPAAGG